MQGEYYVMFFDKRADENILVGPHVFVDMKKYPAWVGFPTADEAELYIKVAKQVTNKLFGGTQNFIITKYEPVKYCEQAKAGGCPHSQRRISFYQLKESRWAKCGKEKAIQAWIEGGEPDDR